MAGVVFTEGWWKSAWPKGWEYSRDGQMRKALKAYKAARVGKDIRKVDDALTLLQAEVKPLRDAVKKNFGGGSGPYKAALKTIDAFEKEIGAERDRAKKSGDKTVVMYKRCFAQALSDAMKGESGKGKDIKLPGKLYIEVSVLELLANQIKAMNGEASFNVICNRYFDDHAKDCAFKIGQQLHRDGGHFRKSSKPVIDRHIATAMKNIESDLAGAPKEIMRKLGLSSRLAAEYKLDRKVGVGKAALGAGVSLAGLAVPGTTVLAAAMAIRAAAGLGRECIRHVTSLESDIKSFEKKVASFQAENSKRLREEVKQSEKALAGVEGVLGADFFNSVKNLRAQHKVIEKKQALLNHRSGKMADKILEASKLFGNVSGRFPKQSELHEVALKRQKEVNKLFDKGYDLAKRVNAADEAVDETRGLLLKLADTGNSAEKVEKIVGALFGVLSVAGGAADAVKVGAAAAESLAVVAAGGADELHSRVNELA